MRYTFAPPATPHLAIDGADEVFPVRRIYCVGRNYAAHAVEMGHDPDREAPFFFQKNPDNIVLTRDVPYPSATRDLHHEVEMVVALRSGGRDIAQEKASELVFGYGVGIDLTRRDLQAEAKKLGRPWETAKAFENSAPCGPLTPASRVGHLTGGAIRLTVNGETRQEGDLAQLIWKVPEIIAALSAVFTLAAGDIIMTGTPAGVASVERGDTLAAEIEGLQPLNIQIV